MRYWMGIDVGKSGGIAIVDENNKLVFKCPMPLVASKELDVNAIADMIEDYDNIVHASVEKIHSMAHWGVKNNFVFGGQFYTIQAILSLMGIPQTLVQAKKWQKEMFTGITPVIKDKKLDTKKMSILACNQLFPKEDFTPTEKSTKIHDGMTDASLIALYCKRNF